MLAKSVLRILQRKTSDPWLPQARTHTTNRCEALVVTQMFMYRFYMTGSFTEILERGFAPEFALKVLQLFPQAACLEAEIDCRLRSNAS